MDSSANSFSKLLWEFHQEISLNISIKFNESAAKLFPRNHLRIFLQKILLYRGTTKNSLSDFIIIFFEMFYLEYKEKFFNNYFTIALAVIV